MTNIVTKLDLWQTLLVDPFCVESFFNHGAVTASPSKLGVTVTTLKSSMRQSASSKSTQRTVQQGLLSVEELAELRSLFVA